MNYTIKIGNDINTKDIDDFYPLIDFNIYKSKDWEKIRQRSTFIVQIQDKGKTIGWGRCVDDGTFCMIYDMAVHPNYQRQGIGKTIMDEIKKYVAQNDFYSVSLFYNPYNPTVKEFYQKCGFYELPIAMRLKK
ncbi:MAG: GNAT family N-acetyltransferase [Alphaproteobacteria bacterium]|nr:GNAT family N-acetyltransferase [Alphaproteobacteria bacterium]